MKIISGLWTKKGSSETTLGFGPKKRQKAPSNAPDERALTSTVPSHKVIRMAHGTAAYTYAYGFGGHDAKQCQANGAVCTEGQTTVRFGLSYTCYLRCSGKCLVENNFWQYPSSVKSG